MGSLESSIKFLSYKVDKFNFQIKRDLEILKVNGNINANAINFDIAVSRPCFFSKKNIYVCNLQCNINVKIENTDILSLTSSISGAFSSDQRIAKEMEEKIIKIQMPTILLPYLRGTITSFLANAGFNAVIFPLVNMNEIAEKNLQGLEIQVIDE